MDLMLTLRHALALWPDREAVVDGPRRLTYREFGERIAQAARGLAAKGPGPGNRVAILAPNTHEFLEAYYACAAIGAVLVPLNHRLAPREVGTVLEDCRACCLLAHTECAKLAAAALSQEGPVRHAIWIGEGEVPATAVAASRYQDLLSGRSPNLPDRSPPASDELAQIYYTSGTTGRPKGVMLTHGNVTFHALAAIAELGLTDGDVWLHAAPLFHLADAWATFAITWAGGKHVCLPVFDPAGALALIEREKVTTSNLIPTMLTLMVNHADSARRDLGSLRRIMSGGAPIAPETVRRIIERFGCDFVQTYGMTETSPYLTVSLLGAHHRRLPAERRFSLESRTGRPFLGVDLRVVRSDGSEVAWDDQEVGEITARGPTVTPGYWRRPQATAEAIRDGWLRTGDLAVVNTEGYLNIVDRKKDMIITGGENVYSTEVENVLYEHSAILECAVIGRPDQIWGEVVKAFVVCKPGRSVSEDEIIAFARERLAAFKTPRAVEFISELPRTGSGKISKHALREQEQTGPASSS